MQQQLRRFGFPLGCLMAVLAAVPAAWQEPGAKAPAPAKMPVGVVDFVKVFDAYPKYLQERKRLDELHKATKARLDEMKNQLNERRSQREMLQVDTRERAQADLELDLAVKQYNGLAQIWTEDLSRQADRLAVECYEDIDRAIAKVAKERGVAMVLRVHRETRTDSVDDKIKVFERRLVWYAADEVDLTADVIKQMQVAVAEPKKDAPPAAAKDNPPAKDNPAPPAGKK